VPLGRFVREITELAAGADLPVRWTEVRGAPVALIRLPVELDNEGRRRVVLDRLDVSGGRLLVAGRAEAAEAEPRQPSTAAQSDDKATRQR
jgi:hypothetical protein